MQTGSKNANTKANSHFLNLSGLDDPKAKKCPIFEGGGWWQWWLLSRWLGSGGSRLGTGHRARAAAPVRAQSAGYLPSWHRVHHHGRTGQQPNSGSGRDFVSGGEVGLFSGVVTSWLFAVMMVVVEVGWAGSPSPAFEQQL